MKMALSLVVDLIGGCQEKYNIINISSLITFRIIYLAYCKDFDLTKKIYKINNLLYYKQHQN